MKVHHFFLICFSSTFFLSGCSSFFGPHGLGHFVLVVCKVAPTQTEDAQQRANRYFAKVANHEKPRPWTRYVALQTLDPNPKQQEKYLASRTAAKEKADAEGQPLGSEWVEPSQLHCIMVFDVVTHESVAPSCYVVATLPKIGEVNTYETFPAEFIASSTE
jgi:hypothetical protein